MDGAWLVGRSTFGMGGFTELAELLTELADGSDEAVKVPIALETDKNLLVVALRAAGFTVFPINPLAVARYRERHGQSGKKSDAGDAQVLAEILRTDAHRHRPLPAVSEHGAAIKALARQHQEAVWAMQQTSNRLRSVLLEFYPQALQAFPNLLHKAAQAVLVAAPRPPQGGWMTSPRVVSLLHRCGRRNDPSLVEHILTALRAPALRQPAAVEAALGISARTLLTILAAQQAAVETLEKALAEQFDAHPSRRSCGRLPAWDRCSPLESWPRSGTIPTGLRSRQGCAPSPGPRRSPAPQVAPTTSRRARSATSA